MADKDEKKSKVNGPAIPGTKQVRPGLYVATQSHSILLSLSNSPKPSKVLGEVTVDAGNVSWKLSTVSQLVLLCLVGFALVYLTL